MSNENTITKPEEETITNSVNSGEMEKSIAEVIDRYAENNKNKKILDKVVKEDSDIIKSYILNHKKDTINTDLNTAKVTSIVKSSYNEEDLIKYLKTLDIPGVIVTKEAIDMKALEDALYHNQIKPENIKPYIVNTTTYRLDVKAVKHK